jgi:hypothetical protein
MALLGSVAAFAHVIGGLTNKSLRTQMAAHWRQDYSSAQASYDLRRLRLKGLIERIEGTNAYRVTAHGLRIGAFFTQSSPAVSSSRPCTISPTSPGPLHQRRARSRLHGARTNASLTSTSEERASPLDPKLASSVQSQTVKWI